ncbi:hypothetical protein ACVWY5_003605 [Bradyrhizobium sp. USDA 3256]
MATNNSSTKPLSRLFRDPYVAAAFRRAEDDGLTGELVEAGEPRQRDGGAAERILETA